jgi:hypothetical protein
MERSQLAGTVVSPDFFSTMRLPIRQGRALTRGDMVAKLQRSFPGQYPQATQAAEAVVVNETFARRFFGGTNAVGHRFTVGSTNKPWTHEIVGVVGDMRRRGLQVAAVPEYFALGWWTGELVVRTTGDPVRLAPTVRQILRADDPHALITDIGTVEAGLGALHAERRFQTMLVAIFAAIALGLAAIGIYGLVRFTLAQRRREIGIRIALGAQPAAVMRLMLGRGVTLVAVGTAAGLAGAFTLTGLFRHFVFGITVTDPWTLAGVVFVLATVAAVACYVPARRASRVDPVSALRTE